jgi:hypothetical protein
VDARDCAEAQVRLAEDTRIRPFTHADGGKYLLCSTDRVFITDLAARLQWLHPELVVDTEVAAKDSNPSYMFQSKADDLIRFSLVMDNSKVRAATGLAFRPLDESLRDTVASLHAVGGLQPRLRPSL